MTLIVFFAVSLFGGLGATLRYGLDRAARSIPGLSGVWWPVGTLFVNVTGSFAIGVLAAVATGPWQTILTVGLLGGYTTFSAVSLESAQLGQDRGLLAGTRVGRAGAYALGTLILGVGAALAGLSVGGALSV